MLALLKASLGIAMHGGSGVAGDVAGMILSNDSFGTLRPPFREGRCITGGTSHALYLVLTRVATTSIIMAVTMIGLDFLRPGPSGGQTCPSVSLG